MIVKRLPTREIAFALKSATSGKRLAGVLNLAIMPDASHVSTTALPCQGVTDPLVGGGFLFYKLPFVPGRRSSESQVSRLRCLSDRS